MLSNGISIRPISRGNFRKNKKLCHISLKKTKKLLKSKNFTFFWNYLYIIIYSVPYLCLILYYIHRFKYPKQYISSQSKEILWNFYTLTFQSELLDTKITHWHSNIGLSNTQFEQTVFHGRKKDRTNLKPFLRSRGAAQLTILNMASRLRVNF